MYLIDDDDDRNYRVVQMEQILLQIFLYHEYNVDEQVKHDQHHHNPKQISNLFLLLLLRKNNFVVNKTVFNIKFFNRTKFLKIISKKTFIMLM